MKQYIAKAPSNIALIKYWGKQNEARQWPANDSLSMSLDQLHTETRANILKGAEQHEIRLNGQKMQAEYGPGQKIFAHLNYLAECLGGPQASLAIDSSNRFPTGCGIASSASGMAALTIAALATWLDAGSLDDLEGRHDLSREQLAHFARQGSGSAGRSLWGGFVEWQVGRSANEQRLVPCLDAEHWPLRDTVVLFSEQTKSTSSTDAHRLAWSSPLFLPRLAALGERMQRLKVALEQRNMAALGDIIEQDCLEMHGVIMSATPPVHYFTEETASFLAWVRKIRSDSGIPVYFTLDAGPNVHLIYQDCDHKQLMEILGTKIETNRLLCDQAGKGPTLTSKFI